MKFYALLVALLLTTVPPAMAAPLQEMTFAGQLPADTNPWTVPARGTIYCTREVTNLPLQWREPDAGVTSATGVLVMLHGIDSTSFCNRIFMEWGTPWANSRDVIVCNVYYRNIPFYPPYDFGIYQTGDVFRGLGQMLQMYPQVDRRRLYLLGSSGGGHVALQTLAFAPDLWAEVYAHCPITKITREVDVQQGLYEEDPQPYGWNVNYCPPYRVSTLTANQRRQLEAEIKLRSPQSVLSASPGIAELETSVAVFHGSADPTTDHQHLLDLHAAVQSTASEPTQILDHAGAIGLAVGSWRFWLIENGDHSFAGAHPDLASRQAATNTLFPAAFTSHRSSVPSLVLDSRLPQMDLWTYHMMGSLANCTAQPVTPASVDDWAIY